MSHGLGGSLDDWKPLAEKLKDRFAVYRFDYNSLYGRTEIPIQTMSITRDLGTLSYVVYKIRQEKNIIKNRIGFYGHSLGGALAIMHASKDENVKAVVVTSPVSDFKKLLTYIGPFGLEALISKEQVQDVSKYDTRDFAKKLKAPILILAGTQDEFIPQEEFRTLYESIKCEKKIAFFEKGTHDFFSWHKRRDEALELASLWFERYLK